MEPGRSCMKVFIYINSPREGLWVRVLYKKLCLEYFNLNSRTIFRFLMETKFFNFTCIQRHANQNSNEELGNTRQTGEVRKLVSASPCTATAKGAKATCLVAYKQDTALSSRLRGPVRTQFLVHSTVNLKLCPQTGKGARQSSGTLVRKAPIPL